MIGRIIVWKKVFRRSVDAGYLAWAARDPKTLKIITNFIENGFL